MPKPEFSYLKPPRLVKGYIWQIEWEEFIPGSRDTVRIRRTFDLNRSHFITNPSLRQERAVMILEEKMKQWSDLSRTKDQVRAALGSTNIVTALDVALQFKCTSDREHTRITYTSFRNIFCEWLRTQEWDKLPIGDFDRNKAKTFLDWVITDRRTRAGNPISNRTYNNYIINSRSLFMELLDRDYLKDNPFSNHKMKKEDQKLRHAIDQDDSNKIAEYAYSHDRTIYLVILLISHCGLRISELRRLRARDIDIERGLIVLGGNQTKNHDLAFITVPQTALATLRSFEFEKIPGSHLIFGEDMKPHPNICCGRNSITTRFRQILKTMKKMGTLRSIEGYSAYSWKDTGAIAMVKSGMDILAIQKHLRHKDLSTTQRYLQSLGIINRDVRDFSGVIFNLPEEFQTKAA